MFCIESHNVQFNVSTHVAATISSSVSDSFICFGADTKH